MVVVVLFIAGDHVPVTKFKEVTGNAGNADPVHIGETGLKRGMIVGLTIIVKETEAAHWPVSGVKI